MIISEEELIAAAKSYWKERGFKKVKKRWTKTVGDFTFSFLIQGSIYDKEFYYVRPGVFFNVLQQKTTLYYGHIWKTIKIEKVEQILRNTEEFFEEWTDKTIIKKRVKDFIEWDKRNPLEKRRAGLVNYDEDPVPADLFLLNSDELTFLLNEW